MQIFIYCKATLHVLDVTAPIIRSIKNCTRSLRYRPYYLYRYSPPTRSDRDRVPIRPRWRGVAVQVVWPVPEAAGTVFNTPDDGCCDIQNMSSSFAVNKYLLTVVYLGFLFTLNYDARNHEIKISYECLGLKILALVLIVQLMMLPINGGTKASWIQIE